MPHSPRIQKSFLPHNTSQALSSPSSPFSVFAVLSGAGVHKYSTTELHSLGLLAAYSSPLGVLQFNLSEIELCFSINPRFLQPSLAAHFCKSRSGKLTSALPSSQHCTAT